MGAYALHLSGLCRAVFGTGPWDLVESSPRVDRSSYQALVVRDVRKTRERRRLTAMDQVPEPSSAELGLGQQVRSKIG